MATVHSTDTAAESPHPSTIELPERPKRKGAARHLTPAELNDWYAWLNAHLERQRLAVAQSALSRSSRRLLKVRAQSAYLMRAIAWWQGMTLRERLEALRAADTAEPAEAWHYRESMRRPVGYGESPRQTMEVAHG